MAIDNTSAQVGDPFAYLYPYQFVQLTTFRKNGEGIATPVWFAHANGKLYITTTTSTGKVKRIRNNGRAELVPCDRGGKLLGDGKIVRGVGRELPASEHATAHAVLLSKYGFFYRVFMGLGKLRKIQRTFLEISAV